MNNIKELIVTSEKLSRKAYPNSGKGLGTHQSRKRFGCIDILLTNDYKTQCCHITQAGSDELNDWLKNLCFWPKKMGQSKVHGAYLREINKYIDDIRVFVMRFRAEKYTLVFDGHSRGGAMSVILAMRLFLTKPPKEPIKIITFGAPKAIKKLGSEHAWVRESTINVINKADFITRVPFGWRSVGTDIVRNINRRGQDHTIYKQIVEVI